MDREWLDLAGSWSPPQVRGFMDFSVTCSSDVNGVRIHKRVTSRRQFKMTMAPCPDALAEAMGTGFGSLLHINPVELGRRVDSWREPIPAPVEEVGGRP